ncbi:site-specific DNA-methyltransferase [Stutzerimonas degradans]|nr:site-specific DNA-methyltransferase [Stutzerimonas degradans]
MGSKSKIMDFVVEGLNDVARATDPILDLFAGSASLAGAIGRQRSFHSNDVQAYSSVLSRAYAQNWRNTETPTAATIVERAFNIVNDLRPSISDVVVSYDGDVNIQDFIKTEVAQRALIERDFHHNWHLFLKNYSGTWWSAEQCLWIDAIREVAEAYSEDTAYEAIIASLMFAMAYCSQGTGHYAQYRDAGSDSSLKDILIYRRRSIPAYFLRKFEEALSWLPNEERQLGFSAETSDYATCLDNFDGGTVYADPPYCFVHYSRFYHALETLVLYDYPELQVKGNAIVKGRYRVSRHQSPFSIASQVEAAFEKLFQGVRASDSRLVLSYSNTGMIALERMGEIAAEVFSGKEIELLTMDHQHMTLGRTGIRHRDVKECLLLVK